MKLTLAQIRSAALGAEQVLEGPDGVELHRFTAREEQWYEPYHHRYKCESTAGIALQFWTDSPTLELAVLPKTGSTRSFWAAEVFEDGKKLGDLKNFRPEELSQLPYSANPFPLEAQSARFPLKGGSLMRIVLPWSVKLVLQSVTLADGSDFRPVRPQKRVLCYGDSITHGYDARYPSHTYAVRLAGLLDAEITNKAIGGEVFQPMLAECTPQWQPDLITVAYGTNDWSQLHLGTEKMLSCCREFYHTLAQKHPGVPIVAITPIWRIDMEPNHHGPFSMMSDHIHGLARELPQLHPVEGLELLPPEVTLTADLRVHPTDEGFAHYAKNLHARIRHLI